MREICLKDSPFKHRSIETHPNPMNRRSFLGSALAAVATASVGRHAVAAEEPSAARPPGGDLSLREKFFGCIAGCHID